jgi:hypothetical protein
MVLLLETHVGYCIDFFAGDLTLRPLESGEFAVSRGAGDGRRIASEAVFKDARAAVHAFEEARRDAELGYDFEWVDLPRHRALVVDDTVPLEDRVYAAGNLIDSDQDDDDFSLLVELAGRGNLPDAVARELGGSVAMGVRREGRASDVREVLSPKAREGFDERLK